MRFVVFIPVLYLFYINCNHYTKRTDTKVLSKELIIKKIEKV